MKNTGLLLLLVCLSASVIQPLELQKVGEWSHKGEYWDVKSKILGVKGTRYWSMLTNDQVLCTEWRSMNFHRYDTRYYIKNYMTGEITYRFENTIQLYGGNWALWNRGDNFVKDQYGAYIFLLKNGGLVLFDVEEKREYIPGEPLKRPDKYIYYTRGNRDERQILKHNIVTGKIEEVRFKNLTRDELRILQSYNNSVYYLTLENIGSNRLRFYNNYRIYILQLDETMTGIISVSEKKIKDVVKYIIPIDRNNYIAFNETPYPYVLDEVEYYYVLLLDENGNIQKEYKDIAMVHNDGSINDTGIFTLCLISPNKQYILLFDTYSEGEQDVYVYKIIYGAWGTLNDNRVRVRASPDLSGEILWIVNCGDEVDILEIGQEKQSIGGVESVWYKIRTDANVEGWVFGAYVDIR